jgi:hypothetical protein
VQQSTHPGVHFGVASRTYEPFFKNVAIASGSTVNAERFTGSAIFHPIKLDTILGFRCPFDAIKAVPALCFQVPEFTVLGYDRRGARKSDYGEGQAETGPLWTSAGRVSRKSRPKPSDCEIVVRQISRRCGKRFAAKVI